MLKITKICSKCKVEHPLSCFSKQATGKNGYTASCKKCYKQYNSENYIKNKAKINKQNNDYRKTNPDKIVAQNKQWYESNKEKILAQQKEYYKNNKEKVSAQGKEYREANKSKISKRQSEHHAKNKARINTRHLAYYQTPMGKAVRANSHHKRRTITKQGDVSTTQILELQQTATHCAYCQADLKETGMHIDHFMPLSKGGIHSLSNLVIACPTCNHRKSAKDPFEFLLELTEKI